MARCSSCACIPRRAAEGDWQARALTVLARGARSAVPAALAALREDHIAVLVPGADATLSLRAAESALRSAESGMTGFVVVIGRSRVAADPMDLHRAASEAMLAANVAAPADESVLLSFEDTGAYRLLLPAMSEDPAELERFYSDTIAPLIAYDEQYGTELVHTLETFLDNDGSMAATYKQLYTHRHTIRYRLERVKELTGLDVGSTDGRERLGLGLKAMRVLGVRAPVRAGVRARRRERAGPEPPGRRDEHPAPLGVNRRGTRSGEAARPKLIHL